MAIDILSALEIVTESIKEYVNKKKNVSYGESQTLDASARTIAKNNVGVYVQSDEPSDAQNGDIWIDSDDGATSESGTYSDYLPPVTILDAGKFMRVSSDGTWAVEAAKEGYIPIKGVDYFTDEDKEELIIAIIKEIPNAEEVYF